MSDPVLEGSAWASSKDNSRCTRTANLVRNSTSCRKPSKMQDMMLSTMPMMICPASWLPLLLYCCRILHRASNSACYLPPTHIWS